MHNIRPSLQRLPGIFLAVLAACRLSTDAGGPGGDPALGAAARITWQELRVAGGTPTTTVIVYDSASFTYDERTCPVGDDVSRCPGLRVLPGRADSAALRDVFRMAQSAEFRALRASYGFSGMQPPDVHQVTLTVVSHEQRRQVTFDARTTYPGILSVMLCRLRQAQGYLILCVTAP